MFANGGCQAAADGEVFLHEVVGTVVPVLGHMRCNEIGWLVMVVGWV